MIGIMIGCMGVLTCGFVGLLIKCSLGRCRWNVGCWWLKNYSNGDKDMGGSEKKAELLLGKDTSEKGKERGFKTF